MKLNILTIFPEYFSSPFATSILKRALVAGAVEINIVDIREFATDKHRLTDDRPFGGGPGMVMKVEPIDLALESLGVKKNEIVADSDSGGVEKKSDRSKFLTGSKIILTSAKGKIFNQNVVKDYSKLQELTIVCGHYEGVDERVAQNLVDEEIRIGDYVLTGGEPAALVISDAVIRLLPKVLGNEESNKNESHSTLGTLGIPQYTRPQNYKGWEVPEVLLGGDHQKVAEWREGKTTT
ncbi:tRNA (guanosine(37)-N1)-methyltransferase TrmD [Patescibacteria group bacterium]|nr:tRNA (guanosine(37)-N1)-methyltransferase TrmD [Patescibacteria group bacterium]